MQRNRINHTLGFIALLHSVGVAGLSYGPTRSLFLQLTPLNLLLSATLLIQANKDYSARFFLAAVTIAASGFVLEAAGVATEMIFGSYRYGSGLGLKWMEVPLLIGVNWFILTFAGYAMTRRLPGPEWLRWVAGAAALVLLDWVMEPVAVALDFWSWKGGVIPMQNYIAWGLAALTFQGIFSLFRTRVCSQLGTGFYLIQLIFFILMRIFYR